MMNPIKLKPPIDISNKRDILVVMTNIRIFEVGGSIRNELMGRPPSDRDFAVISPDYETMRQHLLDIGCTFYQERPQFVSIRAKHPVLGAVDFTLARKEAFYTDARNPDSVTPALTIEDDLARRDFRLNAIAREVGSLILIDPFNGQYDIAAKSIQSVGNAIDRFKEDRLRICRAIRFSCQLGFSISQEIHDAIDEFRTIEDFIPVTKEMMQIELCKAFSANWRRAISILQGHPSLWEIIEAKDIWLKPTLKAR